MTTLPHSQRKIIRESISSLFIQRNKLEADLHFGRKPEQQLIDALASVFGTKDPQALLTALSKAHEHMESTYHGQLRDLAKNDLTAYIEFMNPDEPPPDHIIWLCEHLMLVEARHIMRLMISMPPGHAKSNTCSRYFPSWYLGRNKKHKYLQGGHTQTFCENEFGKPTKAMVDSDRFREVFPDVRLSHDTKSAGTWALAGIGMGKYYTKGVGVGISGFRASCAAIDDPFASREDAESATIRDKVFNWFSADFTTRLLPNAPMFIVATRWHSDDLCGRVEQMSQDGKGLPWTIINLPALAEDEDDPLGRPLGEPLWKDFYTKDMLNNLRATLPARDWNSLYRGKPVDAEGSTLKLEWFQRYMTLPPREQRKRTVVSVDSASKDNERADFTAIGVWIESYDGKHYLAHVHRERLEFNDLVKTVENIAVSWKADMILIEDRGSGTQYIQTRGQGKAPCAVVPVAHNQNSKEFRMDGVSPMIEGGLVSLPSRADWLALYEAELNGFPSGKYDDQVDMTSQYLDYARTRVGGKTAKVTGATTGTGKQGGKAKQKALSQIDQALRQIAERAAKDPITRQIVAQREAAEAAGD